MILEEIQSDVFLINLEKFQDERGFFLESYNKSELSKLGIDISFIQDNLSFSSSKNTIRGLHYQKPPFNQNKLITVLQGSIFDVFIDIRKNSDNYGFCNSIILDGPDKILLIPAGFVHGFCTLENNTIVSYKVDKQYNRMSECGIIWNDHELNIEWPFKGGTPILSDKDKSLSSWNSFMNELKEK